MFLLVGNPLAVALFLFDQVARWLGVGLVLVFRWLSFKLVCFSLLYLVICAEAGSWFMGWETKTQQDSS